MSEHLEERQDGSDVSLFASGAAAAGSIGALVFGVLVQAAAGFWGRSHLPWLSLVNIISAAILALIFLVPTGRPFTDRSCNLLGMATLLAIGRLAAFIEVVSHWPEEAWLEWLPAGVALGFAGCAVLLGLLVPLLVFLAIFAWIVELRLKRRKRS